MPEARPDKIVDETHEISRRRGNGKLRREIWVDAGGRIVRFNLAFINREYMAATMVASSATTAGTAFGIAIILAKSRLSKRPASMK